MKIVARKRICDVCKRFHNSSRETCYECRQKNFRCAHCDRELTEQIFVGDVGGDVFCNEFHYLSWYKNNFDLGYYTTAKNYQEYLDGIERRLGR